MHRKPHRAEVALSSVDRPSCYPFEDYFAHSVWDLEAFVLLLDKEHLLAGSYRPGTLVELLSAEAEAHGNNPVQQ